MDNKKDIVNVIIASPSDLKEERDHIPTLFTAWNNAHPDVHIEPKMYESCCVPEMGGHPQQIINKQMLDDGHLLVAMFWSKIGTETPNAKSGTIEEIREFITKKGGSRVLVYFCDRPLPHGPSEIDHREIERLQDFREEMNSQGLYRSYTTASDFSGLLYQHLDMKVSQLLRGDLPVPRDKNAGLAAGVWYKTDHPDERLRNPIDFGNSLPKVANEFSKKMDDIEQQDGTNDNKFLDLGVHIYMSVADAIGYALVIDSSGVPYSLKSKFKKIISRLEKLSESKSIEEFSKFWNEGRKISNDLNKLTQKMDSDNS